MSVTSRDQALATLEEGHRAIGDLVRRLDDDAFVRGATIGGGDWSAKDLLGHLTTWEEIALRTLDEWRRSERPSIEDVFRTDDVDRLNEESVARSAPLAAVDIRAAAEAVHARLVAAIRETTDDEWVSRAPYETERRTALCTLLGSVLGAPKRPFGHAFAHLQDLDAYVLMVRRPGA